MRILHGEGLLPLDLADAKACRGQCSSTSPTGRFSIHRYGAAVVAGAGAQRRKLAGDARQLRPVAGRWPLDLFGLTPMELTAA